MIAEHHARYLIDLPKKIAENEELLDYKLVTLEGPFVARIPLLCEKEEEFSFFIDIWQSAKSQIRFSLHLQEDSVNQGLLRVDFNGRHKNPETANANVPENFRPYTGLWLDEYPGHIHYIVDGYAPLIWAIPLEIDSFPIKRVDKTEDTIAAFQAFCKTIKVQTEITVSNQLTLF